MKKYILLSLALSVVLLLIFYFLNDVVLNSYLHPNFPALVIFFFIQSFAIAWMLSMGEKDRAQFPIYALGSVAFRFVSGILFLIIFFVIDVENPVALTVQFMGLYLAYLIFEIIVVLANLRRN